MFGDKLFRINVPYSEYWIPLVIGMGVGLMVVVMLRSVLHKRSGYVPRDEEKKPAREFDPFTEGSRSDQRRSFRRQGSPIRVFFATPDRKDTPLEGWVIDRSMGGLWAALGHNPNTTQSFPLATA